MDVARKYNKILEYSITAAAILPHENKELKNIQPKHVDVNLFAC